ncbi:hypothetical protein SDC9_148025 [bioreactor metagenome]|uniref:Uncharacterized protein n=1 Tax=bioreactor metagenome TaxID=1076179 RepID=A0A645EGE9_9ZZZZ
MGINGPAHIVASHHLQHLYLAGFLINFNDYALGSVGIGRIIAVPVTGGLSAFIIMQSIGFRRGEGVFCGAGFSGLPGFFSKFLLYCFASLHYRSAAAQGLPLTDRLTMPDGTGRIPANYCDFIRLRIQGFCTKLQHSGTETLPHIDAGNPKLPGPVRAKSNDGAAVIRYPLAYTNVLISAGHAPA